MLNAADLSFRTTVIPEGATADARIEYNSQGATLAGLQFDLQYDKNALTVDVTIGSAAAAAGKALSTAVQPNGDVRVMIVGFNQTVIENGGIVDLKITVNASATNGPQLLRLVDIIGVTPDAMPAAVRANQPCRVIVIPKPLS